MSTAAIESDAATKDAPVVPLRRNRDFQILWSGRAIAGLGQEVAGISFPLLMLAVTGSAGYAGLLATGQLVAMLLVSLPAGVLADRLNRRTIMIVCDLARGLIFTTLTVLVIAGLATIPIIIAAATASAIFHGFFNPVAMSAMKQLVPTSQLAAAQAQNEARMRVTGLIGPPIGGWLFGLGRALPFIADAVTYLLAAAALLFIRKPLQAERAVPQGPAESPLKAATAGLRHMWKDRRLRYMMAWSMAINLSLGGLYLTMIATWRERGATEGGIGALVAVATLGGLTGALLAPVIIRKMKPSLLILCLAWGLPVGVAAMGLVPGIIPIAALNAVLGLLLPALNALGIAYITAGTPDALQGRVAAAASFLSMLLQPLAPVTIGTIFDASGSTAAFLTMAGMALAGAFFTLTKAMRTIPRPEQLG
ncbi:MFS transporter [Actinorhabdospora filicis]|uniref:MFS transporter n=1 Tax=Actinorhabdospora filicis TaxID=1785913 RepID=A0A9W6SFU4_9ACTN|nr:MFS transporter [Actinorhabdospora filicis]GLZ75543.1 MFS transporter [Actinorhabdospora filicis]